MNERNVTISIDTLRIHGLSRIDGRRFEESFISRLNELASAHAAQIQQSCVAENMNMAGLHVSEHTSANQMGREAAALLWKGLIGE
jgi:hypothetical protein